MSSPDSPQVDLSRLSAAVERLNVGIPAEMTDEELAATIDFTRGEVKAVLGQIGVLDGVIPMEIKANGKTVERAILLRTAFMIAAVTHAVMSCLSEKWPNDELRQSFIDVLVPDIYELISAVQLYKQTGDHNVLARFSPYLRAARKIEGNSLGEHFFEGAPDDKVLAKSEGALRLEVNPTDSGLPRMIADAVATRFVDAYDLHRKQRTALEQRDWKKWVPRIEVATPADLAKVVSVYESVKILPQELENLCPEQPVNIRIAETKRIQKEGGFLYPCDEEDIQNSFDNGRILAVRDVFDPKNFAAYYGVIHDSAVVREYMERELRFSQTVKYINTTQLPEARNASFALGSGDKQRMILGIKVTNEPLALSAFQAAKEGRLTWSVDQALRPMPQSDGTLSGETLARNAGMATALKRVMYQKEFEEGKTHVIMKIFQIVAIGHVKDGDDWLQNGMLPYPIRNTRSFHMNENIGAEGAFVVEEDIKLGDLILRVRWHYLVNPLAQALTE